MRRASSTPEITRGRMLVSRSTRARNSPPLRASRVALVAAARIWSTRCDSAIRLNFDSACSAAVIASEVSARPSSPPAPSRTMAFSRSITSLHRARVATRRLRAALPLVASDGRAGKITKSVRRLTRVLGPVRELDVALLILDELDRTGEVPQPGIDRLRASIVEERERLQADVREEIDEFDVDKLRKRALKVARHAGEDGDPHESAAARRDRIIRRARRLEATIEHAAGVYLPDRLHDV